MNVADVRRKIMERNDRVAGQNRRRFADAGTLVIDVASSPGAGKTTLLAETARRLDPAVRASAIVGDVATEWDADRLRAAGLPAQQIVTGGACHLDARMVEEALPGSGFPELDLLFLENVGNLVCPASWDLGEDFKVALLSVTEGHDKPFKYPALFRAAEVVVVTKLDLLPHLDFDLEAVRHQVHALHPGTKVIELSVKDGAGVDAWCDLLSQRLEAKRPVLVRT